MSYKQAANRPTSCGAWISYSDLTAQRNQRSSRCQSPDRHSATQPLKESL